MGYNVWKTKFGVIGGRRGKIRRVAQVKVENRKLWRKWYERDGQGPQKRGICEDFRELIYRCLYIYDIMCHIYIGIYNIWIKYNICVLFNFCSSLKSAVGKVEAVTQAVRRMGLLNCLSRLAQREKQDHQQEIPPLVEPTNAEVFLGLRRDYLLQLENETDLLRGWNLQRRTRCKMYV